MNGTSWLLAAAAFAAGVINSAAGGGTFLTFPALIFAGLPRIVANATSTVALCPGSLAAAFAYRRDLEGFSRKTLIALVAISLVGGWLGAALLLHTSESTFGTLIPWLLLGATLLFAFGRQLSTAIRKRVHVGVSALAVGQLLFAIYGGYFGAGAGILMLGMMAIAGLTNMNQMNGLKTLLNGCLNAVAVVAFILAGEVRWRPALIMAVAAIIGGYAGGWLARRIDPIWIRRLVIVLGLGLSAYFFTRP